MVSTVADASAGADPLAAEAIATVRRWLAESADIAPDRQAKRLAAVLKDQRGITFTIAFIDRVVRPENLRVAARNLETLSRDIPATLPWHLRVVIQLGGGFAPIIPWPIVPIARRWLRSVLSPLLLQEHSRHFDRRIRDLRRAGTRLTLSPLSNAVSGDAELGNAVSGDAVLGDTAADQRLAGVRQLLERNDVDSVSFSIASVSSQLSLWSFDETVTRVVERLTPLYEFAAAARTTKFITLDLHAYGDRELTVEVFRRLLDQPKLAGLEAGIVLQAYFPDALSVLQELTAWATQRRLAGGAGIRVRVMKGDNLARERTDAEVHGWPLATLRSRVETDSSYKRILDWSFTPTHADAVRIGVATHNLFDIAWAHHLATQRKVHSRVEFEMIMGHATAQADAVRHDVGGLLMHTPVVPAGRFDAAVPYLIHRLEEHASSENSLSALNQLGSDAATFDREATRFRASCEALNNAGQGWESAASHRVQNRAVAVPNAPIDTAPHRLENEADTDPSIAANRQWAREILSRVALSDLGDSAIATARITGVAALETVITTTVRAGEIWGQRRADTRATVVHSAGDSLAAARADLIEVMASETGLTIAEGDSEVSAAVDFAHFYAESARELDRVEDAQFEPSRLIVVVPPSNSPVAVLAGSVLAALASGAGVIVAPSPLACRSAAVLVNALWAGGVPREVLALVVLGESVPGESVLGESVPGESRLGESRLGEAVPGEAELRRLLVAHPLVHRVLLTGSWDTAQLFGSWRSDLPLIAMTGGRNAIIVTESADLDLAVGAVVESAFGHAGQSSAAVSLVILVGSVASSARFRRQLIDAVSTLRVGYPQETTTVIGPIIEPAHGRVLRALTTLDEGESWLVRPRSLDETGRLWSPGVRDGVAPGSEFHLTAVAAPVLGIMRADTLELAIALQNAPASGLVAGIHSLDAEETAKWIETVQAGALFVNRSITGAIVRRAPFGGWKRSTVGESAAAGGPNYLATLGRWRPVFAEPGQTVVLAGLSEKVTRLIEAAQPGMGFLEFDRVRAGAQSDERAWAAEFGRCKDRSSLQFERNLFRYRAVPVTVRLADGASPAQLVRTIAAATRAGAVLSISSGVPVAAGLLRLFGTSRSPLIVEEIVVESDARWHARLESGEIRPGRIRLLGGDAIALSLALGGNVDVAIYAGEVTTAGRIELLAFLREQAISITDHRRGIPDRSAVDPL